MTPKQTGSLPMGMENTPQPGDGWLPIDSAPKGDEAWLIGTDGQKVAPMSWGIECDDDRYTGWCGATAVDGGILYSDHVPLGFEPTHWLPLPPPPSQEQS